MEYILFKKLIDFITFFSNVSVIRENNLLFQFEDKLFQTYYYVIKLLSQKRKEMHNFHKIFNLRILLSETSAKTKPKGLANRGPSPISLVNLNFHPTVVIKRYPR